MRTLLSPAKLNLGLKVLGRRPDGYHLLESLFWPITLHDQIALKRGAGGKLTAVWDEAAPRKGPKIPAGSDNILGKILAAHSSFTEEIHLKKRIPMGAGLGGGSSNAGTLLKHLAEVLQLPAEQIEQEALKLGADVPYFLNPKPAWVTGVGELRRPLEIDSSLYDAHFFLVFPPFECETKSIFGRYKELGQPFSSTRVEAVPQRIGLDNLAHVTSRGQNDLLPAAAALHPLLDEIIKLLAGTDPILSGLSGSGSTCYSVYENLSVLEEKTKGLSRIFRSTHCETATVKTHSVIN